MNIRLFEEKVIATPYKIRALSSKTLFHRPVTVRCKHKGAMNSHFRCRFEFAFSLEVSEENILMNKARLTFSIPKTDPVY